MQVGIVKRTRAGILGGVAIASFGCNFSGPTATPDGSLVPVIDASVDAMPDNANWALDYPTRIRFDVDNSTRTSLENFPLALRFPVDSRMSGFGSNIVFHDGNKRLSHQTEEFGESALVWVEADLPDRQTMSIWMYFGGEPNDLNSGPDTFNEFNGVYHFFDTFGFEDPVDDATEQINLDSLGMTNADTDVGVGRALSVTVGSSQFISTMDAADEFIASDYEELSYEAWFKVATGSADRFILANANANCRGVLLYIGDGTAEVNDGATDAGDGLLIGAFLTADNCGETLDEQTVVASPGRVDDGNWHHAALTIDRRGGDAMLFLDGQLVDMSENTVPRRDDSSNSETRFGSNSLDQSEALDGLLDEVRIGGIRSADWYQATYLNSHPMTASSNTADFVTANPIQERP